MRAFNNDALSAANTICELLQTKHKNCANRQESTLATCKAVTSLSLQLSKCYKKLMDALNLLNYCIHAHIFILDPKIFLQILHSVYSVTAQRLYSSKLINISACQINQQTTQT